MAFEETPEGQEQPTLDFFSSEMHSIQECIINLVFFGERKTKPRKR